LQSTAQLSRQERAIREARDFIEVPPAEFHEVNDILGTKQRFAAAGDHEPRRAAFAGESVVARDIESAPVGAVVAQRADARLREAEGAAQVARDPHW